jgi:hypothetical protein
MGFFNIEMERNILLHPAHFGPRMREILYERLRSEARGRQAHALWALKWVHSARALTCALCVVVCLRRWRALVPDDTALWCW